MAYNVLQVSQYIINYSIENDIQITNLKLQKLLYYTQAAFLTEYDEPCFEEEIEHWRHGPVVSKVYSHYKGYIDKNINDIQHECLDMYIDANANIAVRKIIYNINDFYIEDIELINNIIQSYRNTDPWDLVEKTHEEDPWTETHTNEIIDKKRIQSYFYKHRERIYGDN